MQIQTKRLLLRPWNDEDLEPFAHLNADPRVMEHFPAMLSKNESKEMIQKIRTHFDKNGFGLWAVEAKEEGFIGYIGLKSIDFTAPFTPAVEIGWRLAFDFWGKGYATEGALACLEFAFKTLKLPQVVSLTTMQNFRSMAVMERIGMHRDPKEDFLHPKLPSGHPLQRHVLYRIDRAQFI